MSAWPFAGKPLGIIQLSAFSGVASFTGGNAYPVGSQFVLLSIETNPVRYRDDGTNPSSSDGVLLPETTTEPWLYASVAGLADLRFIPTTGSATVTGAFYG